MADTFIPRNGQWVLVDLASVDVTDELLISRTGSTTTAKKALDLSGAHKSRDGKYVGVYQSGGKDPLVSKPSTEQNAEQAAGQTNTEATTDATSEAAAKASAATDSAKPSTATVKVIPPHIALVRPNGRNLRVLDEDTDEHLLVALKPDGVSFGPLLDLADMPPGRKIAEGWKPKP